MKAEAGVLSQWLSDLFFESGAFLADSESSKVILARGGQFHQEKSFTTESAFYLKDFFTDSFLVFRSQDWLETTREELAKHLDSTFDIEPVISNQQTFDDVYSKDFQALKESFGADLQKVVLVSREVYFVENSKDFRRTLFQRALKFGTGIPFGIWNNEYGVVGSTPELLFKLTGKKLQTIALAGTSELGKEDELLTSSKEKVEHDLVVLDIKEKLLSFSSKVKSSPTEIAPFKSIIHLKTNIEAELNSDADLSELTSLLSPTAALGGYPKKAALEFLSRTQYQKLNPGRYFGSAFGLIHGDFKQFVVSIRNVQWKTNTFFIESGGGVVPASELHKELAEIKLKRETIKKHYL